MGVEYYKSFGVKKKNGKPISVRYYRKYRTGKERIYYDSFLITQKTCSLEIGQSTLKWMGFNNSWQFPTTEAEYNKYLKIVKSKTKLLLKELSNGN